MVTHIFYLWIALLAWNISCQVSLTYTPQTVEKLYGSLNFDQEQQDKILTIFNTIKQASTHDLIQASADIVEQLQEKKEQLETIVTSIHNLDKKIPARLFYTKFIINERINYFTHFIAQHESWLKRLQRLYFDPFYYVFVGRGSQPLSELISQYLDLEENNILYHPTLLTKFLHLKQQYPLPPFLDVWHAHELQERLKKRAKHAKDTIGVQLAGLLLSFAAQGLVLAGGELATQWIDEEDEKKYEELTKQQEQITQSWQTFQKNLQQQQILALKKIEAAYQESQQTLQKSYEETNKLLRQEIVYLNQAINLDKPMQQYLDNWITWDRYFATSRMITPQKHIWYNIFNVFTTDDWHYDTATQQFWQRSLVPMPSTLLWQVPEKEKDFIRQDPSIHAIFTEHALDASSYTIQIECTLVQASYPFFVGCMFNRGRWISGDPERLWWYRLIGFYGTQDEKANTIHFSFAQERLVFEKSGTDNKETIVSPLETIMKNPTEPLSYTLPQQDVDTLAHNPLTFVITINNAPATASITLAKKTNDTLQELYTQTLTNLDSYVYRYHGIGFMSCGCQAAFKILQPETLVFTKEDNEELMQKTQAQSSVKKS